MISVANWGRVTHGLLSSSVESAVIQCMSLAAWFIQHCRSARVKRPRWAILFKFVPSVRYFLM